MDRLTGQALLDKIESLEGVTKAELAIACGYATQPRTPDAAVRPQYAAFQDALLQAKGVELPVTRSKPGRELSYVLRRQANGVVVLGGPPLPIEKGQAFEVDLNREAGEVVLTPVV